jgi:hypothetical protein
MFERIADLLKARPEVRVFLQEERVADGLAE